MAAVWDKLFGNAPSPANDGSVMRFPSAPFRDENETTLRESALFSRNPDAQRSREPERAVLISKTAASTFDSIGRRNENLRAQLDAVEFAFSNIEMIRSHFLGVLAPIDEILREIEHANTGRHDAESKLEGLARAFEKLRSENAELTIDRNAMALKQSEFNARIGDYERTLQKATADLREARTGQSAETARADQLERELDASKRRLRAVSEQLPGLRTEFISKERRLQEYEHQRASLEDGYRLAMQELGSAQARIEDMVGSASKLNRKINDLESRNGDATRRIGDLEAGLSEEKVAHARLLAEARAELRQRNATIRMLEQSALESSDLIKGREQAEAELQRALFTAHAKQSETDGARPALDARANDLARTIDAKSIALRRAEEQIAALEARNAEEVRLAIAELESRDALTDRLRADLEKQTAARAFAEGALQSARQERVSRRNVVDANPATASESQKERFARLRA